MLAPAAWLYGTAIATKNRAFDRGERVVMLDRPVISIGNLTTGGTGKTPTVTRVVETLHAAEIPPVIAMRGYRAAGGVSDEQDIYARRFPSVPVVAQPNRTDGLIDLFATEAGESIRAVVLDDG
ncbi:MAG: tetraacyldisaccharide 4'-kinase, partial [Planctomycetota bacterium]